jgi:hypothetical protein
MDTPRRTPDRTLLIVLAAVAALVIVALVVVFARGAGEPLDESTPAGVVQRYTNAVIAGDLEEAARYLPPAVVGDCDEIDPGPLDDVRVTLTSTTERGDRADVGVSVITTSGGGLFGPSEYQSDETFRLVRSGDAWLIDRAPWQFAVCSESAS